MSPIPQPSDEELTVDARQLLPRLPPLNVLRMFAGAPAAFRPMTALGQAILIHGELDARLREIAILAVARASGSEYERVQHENIARMIGVSEEEIRAAADGELDRLDGDAQLVWRFGEQIARDVRAEEELTAQVLTRFGRRQATELVIACAYYSAVARIIETCGVQMEAERPGAAQVDPDMWAQAATHRPMKST